MASRPLPLPPANQETGREVGMPLQRSVQPTYIQPYHDSAVYEDDSMMQRTSQSFQDEAKGEEPTSSAFDTSTQQHHSEPNDAYYRDPMYAEQGMPRKSSRGIWSYDDRRAFQRQPWWLKLLRILAFILLFGLIVALSVVMLIVLFIRPPNIGLQGLSLPNSASQIQIQQESFTVNASLNAVVSNPNYISAEINNLTAIAYDSNARITSIGNCSVPHRTIQAQSNTNVTVPCELNYNLQQDKNLTIIRDLINRCGLLQSSTKQSLQILLDTHLSIRVLAFHIPISVSPTVSVDCPITKQEVKQLLGSHSDILQQLGLGSLSRRAFMDSVRDRLRSFFTQLSYSVDAIDDTEEDPTLHEEM
ncbi:hypothetical protein MYAM1_000054 [Malassezia yamatoensis]|uniref:Late embryogenesis abundant protein LEA-2 subgroup domain-containing protein n=1 Tax=Malassezia yamatoensis TaxID=253288 RepID=A0AAJ5YVZ9_9BASI|nr:hypothetical protein MYAM1_000054 [Malassezia yamatoensis]